jgi:hypothetical protein
MKLSLRKAHRLVKDLQSHLSVRVGAAKLHHSADEEEILAVISAVENSNKLSVVQSLIVVEVISEIRAAVQALNSQVVDGDSIDSLLNRKVQIESKMRVLAQFTAPSKDSQEKRVLNIKRQVQDAAKNSGSMYSNSEVQVAGYAVEDHNDFNEVYVELKQEQETVSDKLAYINNLLQVEIDDKHKPLLKALQVL